MHARGVFSLCAASPNRSRPSSSRPSREGAVVWLWVWLWVMSGPPSHQQAHYVRTPLITLRAILVHRQSAFPTYRGGTASDDYFRHSPSEPSAHAVPPGAPCRIGALVGCGLPLGPGSSVMPNSVVGCSGVVKVVTPTPLPGRITL